MLTFGVNVARRVVSRLDGLNFQKPLSNAFADGCENETEQSPFQVLTVADDDHVDVGCAVGLAREGVGVARCSSPHIGVGRRYFRSCRLGSARSGYSWIFVFVFSESVLSWVSAV